MGSGEFGCFWVCFRSLTLNRLEKLGWPFWMIQVPAEAATLLRDGPQALLVTLCLRLSKPTRPENDDDDAGAGVLVRGMPTLLWLPFGKKSWTQKEREQNKSLTGNDNKHQGAQREFFIFRSNAQERMVLPIGGLSSFQSSHSRALRTASSLSLSGS